MRRTPATDPPPAPSTPSSRPIGIWCLLLACYRGGLLPVRFGLIAMDRADLAAPGDGLIHARRPGRVGRSPADADTGIVARQPAIDSPDYAAGTRGPESTEALIAAGCFAWYAPDPGTWA